MAIKSDDSYLYKTWLKTARGSSGCYYIQIINEDVDGAKETSTVKICPTGLYADNIKVMSAIAKLYEALEEAGLNEGY